MKNSAWVIQKPSVGPYKADVLALEDRPLSPLQENQVQLKSLFLSLDPSNLMWLKLLPGWMEEVNIGDIMKGPSIAIVEDSNSVNFKAGDFVTGPINWSTRSTISANLLKKINHPEQRPLETNITVFSHVGLAAIIGTQEIAKIKNGETVLVSGAAGATGSLACQIALAKGCRVIGIAGGQKKCQWLIDELGISAAIDYKNENVPESLAKICPEGPEVFFDNVGGALLDSILPLLKVNARITICGQISQYGNTGEGYAYKNLFAFLMLRLRMEGFVVPDFDTDAHRLTTELAELYDKGLLKDKPHILKGIETAAKGLEMLLSGQNHGKLLVRLD